MKRTQYLLLAVVATVMFSSCSTRETALNNMRDFTQELSVEAPSYGFSDWKHAATKYAKLNRKLTKYTYSQEEMEEIGEMQGQCVSTFASAMKSKAEGIGSLIKGFLQGL